MFVFTVIFNVMYEFIFWIVSYHQKTNGRSPSIVAHF